MWSERETMWEVMLASSRVWRVSMREISCVRVLKNSWSEDKGIRTWCWLWRSQYIHLICGVKYSRSWIWLDA